MEYPKAGDWARCTREMHWHLNSEEWQSYIDGRARMGVFVSEGNARTFNYQAGDVGTVPFAYGHYVENIGKTPLRFLEIFRSPYFQDVSLNQWLALTPPELATGSFESEQERDGLTA